MNTPTKNTTEFMQDPNAPRKPIIFGDTRARISALPEITRSHGNQSIEHPNFAQNIRYSVEAQKHNASLIFKPQNDNNVKKCLFGNPIKPNNVKNKFWISKCPKDMQDKYELF
jgi:hypothetical protein